MTSGIESLYGKQMTESEIDQFLEERGYGVLSMVADGVPYGIPLSFGYDGSERLYFVFVGYSEQWKKMTFADESETVSLLALDVESASGWRSAIVTGSFDRITAEEWEQARELIAENAFKPDLLVDVDRQDNPQVWVLEAEEKSGRAVGID
ncbi:pyridoxamine 5'-phosphate oxidase family protein [Halobellus ordinarius]|uniref:pyridoxamine 5'-phosphate oxidase family protein n=1 Tax=Halobellus ordinarius TaxID=3075120 RepID=UPI0028804A6A|nr:pyridoxamine 5'-phosphate oxidase family protein [Halobellus sp. ZY16]